MTSLAGGISDGRAHGRGAEARVPGDGDRGGVVPGTYGVSGARPGGSEALPPGPVPTGNATVASPQTSARCHLSSSEFSAPERKGMKGALGATFGVCV